VHITAVSHGRRLAPIDEGLRLADEYLALGPHLVRARVRLRLRLRLRVGVRVGVSVEVRVGVRVRVRVRLGFG